MFKKSFFTFLLFSLLYGCIQPLELESIEYKDLLVVEALLTNENKHHTVKLSRTFKLDANGPEFETGALVMIKDNSQNTYLFTENANGEYISNQKFNAELDKSYTLEITTKDGTVYSSTPEKMAGISPVGNIEVIKEKNNLNKDGVAFYVNNNQASYKGYYYRYEYQEDYKIIAPYWDERIINILSNIAPWEVEVIVDRNNLRKKTCYKSQNSTSILQTETVSLNNNNYEFKIHFIEEKSHLIAHRYSIKVKQYIQSVNAYNYFKTLKKLSTSESLFTQSQPGQIASNITSKNSNVLGIFEVSSVSEKRIFINREDFFPGTEADYQIKCNFTADALVDRSGTYSPLIQTLEANLRVYYKHNNNPYANPDELYRPYILVSTACGDCSVLGDNNKPSFWID